MTNDSPLFKPRPWWEERGYEPDEYGRWIGPDGDVALPLYQGVMIHHYDFAAKRWVRGTGLNAEWSPLTWEQKRIEPQFLIAARHYEENSKSPRGLKVAFRDIARSTDERTFIGAVVPDMPCGNVLGVLGSEALDVWPAISAMNSLPFDWALRQRIGGTHINLYVAEELPLVPSIRLTGALRRLVARLALPHPIFSPAWMRIYYSDRSVRGRQWRGLWALTPHERTRLTIQLEAIVSALFGLNQDNLVWILRDAGRPVGEFPESLDPKGFWRVDKDKPPERRHTVLTIAAFHDLEAMIEAHDGDRDKGIEAFCNQNDGEGWMLPETLCLSELGLGHDERAKDAQPVRQRMGPRFYDWQLEQSVEESWAECEKHARNILGNDKLERMRGENDGVAAQAKEGEVARSGETPKQVQMFRY